MSELIVNLKPLMKALSADGVRQATLYVSPKEIIRATRRTYGGKIKRGNAEILLTFGKPNYREREFIKLCMKAGEPFPVKKVQVKMTKEKRK